MKPFQIFRRVLPAMALVLSCGLVTSSRAAAELSGSQAQPLHAVDLTTFLGSLQQNDQGLAGNPNVAPAPESKATLSCATHGCPTGQTCWYCHSNWICLYNYSDPNYVPTGCTRGGPQ